MNALITHRVLRFVTPALLILLISAPAAVLRAQATGAVQGTITAEGTNAPIEGAQVSVVGSPRYARTDATGHYRLAGVPAGTSVIRALSIGYSGQTHSVTLQSGATVTLDFSLKVTALSLDAVVVTGTAAEARKKEVGNAMATIDLKLVPAPQIKDAQDMLSGRAAGVTVLGNSGQPGAGGTIRLRGSNSITQGNNPIIYVDGIRIYSQNGPVTAGARQSAAAFNDIKADEIERVEIVKGAAATTLYGTEASGGVIQIFTKRGSSGAPQWATSLTSGVNVMGHVGPKSDPTGLGLNDCSGVHANGLGLLYTDPTCPKSGTWFRQGPVQRLDLEVKGGGDNMTYFMSGNYGDNEGVIKTGFQKDGGFRANFSFMPAKKLMIAFNSAYNRKSIGWIGDGNLANGFTLNVMRGPSNNFKGGKGTDCANVATGTTCMTNAYILDQQISNDADHFITGTTVSWNPIEGLSNRFSVGFDYNSSVNKQLIPFGFLVLPTGQLNQGVWNHTKLSLDYAGSYQNTFLKTFASTLSWGGQLFDDRDRLTGMTGTLLSGPGEPTIGSFATVVLGATNESRVVNAGLFLQEMIGWNDRAFVTGGLRVDGNSAFGSAFGLQTYPKISAAYVLSEEKWWPTNWVQTLKLRAAVGESGKAPGAFDAVRTWDPVAGDEGKPGVVVQQRGNPDLGPERTREVEVGFDIAAFESRVAVELTAFRARTYGALIGVVYPPSEGFSRSQLQNVGTLENKGLEVQINGDILRGSDVDWSGRVNLTSLASNTIDVGGVPISTGTGGSYVREGYPVPGIFGYKIMNPDEIADPVIKSDQYLGTLYPTHMISLGTTVTWRRRLTLDVLGEFQAGGHLTNWIGYQGIVRNVWQPCYAVQAKLIAYNGADAKKGTADDVLNALDGVNASDRGRCAIDATVRNADFWVAKTDFFKLRSVSLSYKMPERYLYGLAKGATITLSGRNLWKSTKYDGADPEANDASDAGSGLGRREYYQLPPFKTFLANVRLTF